MPDAGGAEQPAAYRFGDKSGGQGDSVSPTLLAPTRNGDRCARGPCAMNILEGWHYQNAYVCDDIVAAIAQVRAVSDVGDVAIHDVDQMIATPTGPKRVATRLAFIWIDDLQYELIQVIADDTGIYANCRSNGGPLRFHHICMRVDDWDSFRAKVDQQDLPLVMERATDDQLKFLYLDARATLGHYLEYVWTTDARWAVMQAM
jgi:Glyoxalase/Bleomycin resistance protein/Dioxygenase superfamily